MQVLPSTPATVAQPDRVKLGFSEETCIQEINGKPEELPTSHWKQPTLEECQLGCREQWAGCQGTKVLISEGDLAPTSKKA